MYFRYWGGREKTVADGEGKSREGKSRERGRAEWMREKRREREGRSFER